MSLSKPNDLMECQSSSLDNFPEGPSLPDNLPEGQSSLPKDFHEGQSSSPDDLLEGKSTKH